MNLLLLMGSAVVFGIAWYERRRFDHAVDALLRGECPICDWRE